MALLPGVYQAKQKNGTIYFRSSITFHKKHISLGSFPTEALAHAAYKEADTILFTNTITLNEYSSTTAILSFEKWVMLLNFRDNGIYCKTPIYIFKKFFIYYLSPEEQLKFDVDDLFYYSKRKIQKRGGHLFVADFGMQVTILSRYGIKNFAVEGRDYRFINGDPFDFRYGNIEIINHYHGVTKIIKKGISSYVTKIHIRGDYIVGRYSTETEAAVAYNKAAKILQEIGIEKNFPYNYIVEMDAIEYASLYNKVRISSNIRKHCG